MPFCECRCGDNADDKKLVKDGILKARTRLKISGGGSGASSRRDSHRNSQSYSSSSQSNTLSLPSSISLSLSHTTSFGQSSNGNGSGNGRKRARSSNSLLMPPLANFRSTSNTHHGNTHTNNGNRTTTPPPPPPPPPTTPTPKTTGQTKTKKTNSDNTPSNEKGSARNETSSRLSSDLAAPSALLAAPSPSRARPLDSLSRAAPSPSGDKSTRNERSMVEIVSLIDDNDDDDHIPTTTDDEPLVFGDEGHGRSTSPSLHAHDDHHHDERIPSPIPLSPLDDDIDQLPSKTNNHDKTNQSATNDNLALTRNKRAGMVSPTPMSITRGSESGQSTLSVSPNGIPQMMSSNSKTSHNSSRLQVTSSPTPSPSSRRAGMDPYSTLTQNSVPSSVATSLISSPQKPLPHRHQQSSTTATSAVLPSYSSQLSQSSSSSSSGGGGGGGGVSIVQLREALIQLPRLFVDAIRDLVGLDEYGIATKLVSDRAITQVCGNAQMLRARATDPKGDGSQYKLEVEFTSDRVTAFMVCYQLITIPLFLCPFASITNHIFVS
jgi:hypothetical protein